MSQKSSVDVAYCSLTFARQPYLYTTTGSKAVAILRQGGHEVVAGSLPDYQKIDMHPSAA